MHKVLIKSVETLLHQIMNEGYYADKVIEKHFKANPQFGSRDRGFIAETTYNLVRYFRKYQFIAKSDNIHKIISTYFFLKDGTLEPWMELNQEEKKTAKEKLIDAETIRSVRESIPDWMDSTGFRELGETWDLQIAAMNLQAPVVLRVNTIKSSLTKAQQILEQEGILTEPHALYPDALILQKRKNVFSTAAFKQGICEVQDSSSQCVAPFLEVAPGMRVIDACAGAGGKALHIASLMKNKGNLICLDKEQWKLDELKKRSKRNGISIIETRLIENNKVIKRLHDTADRLLLDVPCSGMGVLKRNPDAKWKLNPGIIEELKILQKQILDQYHPLLKNGGKLVYATCSIFPSENQDQIQSFLSNNPEYSLEDEKTILPEESGFDGFYMARLVKSKK